MPSSSWWQHDTDHDDQLIWTICIYRYRGPVKVFDHHVSGDHYTQDRWMSFPLDLRTNGMLQNCWDVGSSEPRTVELSSPSSWPYTIHSLTRRDSWKRRMKMRVEEKKEYARRIKTLCSMCGDVYWMARSAKGLFGDMKNQDGHRLALWTKHPREGHCIRFLFKLRSYKLFHAFV